MTVRRLDHYNILTPKYEETLAFYGEVLEMTVGPTPMGDMTRGAWIRDDGGLPIVHVQKVDPASPEKKFDDVRRRLGAMIGPLSIAGLSGGGAVEHVALECDDYDRLLARLRERGYDARTNEVPQSKLRQIFIPDPNGIILELNFRGN